MIDPGYVRLGSGLDCLRTWSGGSDLKQDQKPPTWPTPDLKDHRSTPCPCQGTFGLHHPVVPTIMKLFWALILEPGHTCWNMSREKLNPSRHHHVSVCVRKTCEQKTSIHYSAATCTPENDNSLSLPLLSLVGIVSLSILSLHVCHLPSSQSSPSPSFIPPCV